MAKYWSFSTGSGYLNQAAGWKVGGGGGGGGGCGNWSGHVVDFHLTCRVAHCTNTNVDEPDMGNVEGRSNNS